MSSHKHLANNISIFMEKSFNIKDVKVKLDNIAKFGDLEL